MLTVELKTKAGKLPVIDRVREILVAQVIPILLEEQDQFYKGNGDNLTIGQDSFNCELKNEDGTPAGRVMFSWSPNVWGPKVEGAKKSGKSAFDEDRISLVPKEIAALDAAIATLKQNGDIDNAVKLATIKSVASQQGGKVSRNDYKVVMALGAE